jgi:septal ring factor EnvC (AmiA/AmiB activator)
MTQSHFLQISYKALYLILILTLSSCAGPKPAFLENNASLKTFSYIPKPAELRIKDLQNKGTPIASQNIKSTNVPQVVQNESRVKPLEQDTQVQVTQSSDSKERLLWPVKGKVVITFSEQVAQKKIVPGIHILAYKNCPVRAAEPGVVQYSGKYTSSMNIVVINSYPHTKTVYGYLGGDMPKRGDKISAGQIIGYVIGKEERPVLYFALRKNNMIVDPLKYLQ